MKAILIIDNISNDLNIEELRADIKVNCYGDVMAIYNNVSLRPIPQEFIHGVLADTYEDGYNDCLYEILGGKE